MLRITTQTNETETVFELEGKLAGPWVQELESTWRRAAGAPRPVKARLKAVTFIDGGGKKLLAEMRRQGVELVAEGCMTKAIVEEIISAALPKAAESDSFHMPGKKASLPCESEEEPKTTCSRSGNAD